MKDLHQNKTHKTKAVLMRFSIRCAAGTPLSNNIFTALMVKNVHLSSSVAIPQLVNHQKMLSHDGMKVTKQIIMNIYFDKDSFFFKEENLNEIIKDEKMYTCIMNH